MAKASTDNLKDMLECSICMDEFSDPRMLPCIHTFCFKCLERTGEDKQPGDIMACPLCRKEFNIPENGIGGIQKNFFIDSLVNMHHLSRVETKVFCDACLEDSVDDPPPAVLFCIECKQRLCDGCCKAHRRVKVLKQHQLINLGDKDAIEQLTRNSTQSFCMHHENEPIKMYCMECKVVNCLVCQVECHQGHKCLSVGKVSEEFKLKLHAGIGNISSCVEKCVEGIWKLDEENRLVLENSKSLESDVLKRVSFIKDIVDQHANKLLMEMGTNKTKKLNEIETRKEEISRQMAMLESYKRYANEMLEKGSHVDICRNFEDMKTRSDELENNYNISHGSASDYIGAYAYTFIPSEIDDFLKSTENMIGKVSGLQLVRKIHPTERSPVFGVTWLENKIYTIHPLSTMVHTFQDHEPFSEETPIEIKDMDDPSDMASSKMARTIFICDEDDNNPCLWRIQMPDRMVRRYKIYGQPRRLSITPSDDLLVMVVRQNRFYLDIYRSSDVKRLQSIPMPTKIQHAVHAVQTTNGNFIIACDDSNFPDGFVVSELSEDGTQILRTFDLQSIDSIPLKTWKPCHIAIDEDGNIFVTDYSDDGHRVFQLHSRLNRIEMELNHDRLQIDRPWCLCYVQEKNMLIVGQVSPPDGAGSVCVFDCWKN